MATLASARVLPPGGEGEIEVRYETRNRRGKGTKGVGVYTNDPATPMVPLAVRADLRVVLEPEPRIIDVGKILWNEEVTRELRLTGPDAADTRIVAAEFRDAGRPDRPGRPVVGLRAPGDSGGDGAAAPPVQLTVAGSKPGQFLGTAVLTTNHPLAAELDVRLSGEVIPPVTWRPNRLVFANADSGQPTSQSIVVRATGDQPAGVLEAVTDHPSLKTAIRRLDAGRHEVTVDFDGLLGDEPATATVTIRTSNPSTPTLQVDVTFQR